jgi:hypothetical protein
MLGNGCCRLVFGIESEVFRNGCRVSSVGCRVKGIGCRIWGRVLGVGYRV